MAFTKWHELTTDIALLKQDAARARRLGKNASAEMAEKKAAKLQIEADAIPDTERTGAEERGESRLTKPLSAYRDK